MPIKKPPLCLNSQGSVVVTIFLTLFVVIGIGFVYFYYTKLNSLGTVPLPLVNSTPPPNDETANWKSYEDPTIGVSLKIPNDWYISEDNKNISQFPYNPKRFSTSDIYNVFYISRIEFQLQSGYTNDDWLNRINNLKPDEKITNEYRPATTLQVAKLGSGKTAEGFRYVVFKNTVLDEGVLADFQKNQVVYQFVLQHYNQEGIDTLEKILSTVIISAPTASPN